LSPEPRADAARVELARRARGAGVRESDLEAVRVEIEAERLAAARAEGVAEGERRALEAAAGALARAAAAVDARAEAESARLAESAVALAVEIARFLLKSEIDAGHYDLERIVRETLSYSGVGRGRCVVHRTRSTPSARSRSASARAP
jgi:hypothetical protein